MFIFWSVLVYERKKVQNDENNLQWSFCCVDEGDSSFVCLVFCAFVPICITILSVFSPATSLKSEISNKERSLSLKGLYVTFCIDSYVEVTLL